LKLNSTNSNCYVHGYLVSKDGGNIQKFYTGYPGGENGKVAVISVNWDKELEIRPKNMPVIWIMRVY